VRPLPPLLLTRLSRSLPSPRRCPASLPGAAWCLAEAIACHQLQIRFDLCIAPCEHIAFMKALHKNPAGVQHKPTAFDVARAEASVLADREMIMESVRRAFGAEDKDPTVEFNAHLSSIIVKALSAFSWHL
jgi:hypothetical protein